MDPPDLGHRQGGHGVRRGRQDRPAERVGRGRHGDVRLQLEARRRRRGGGGTGPHPEDPRRQGLSGGTAALRRGPEAELPGRALQRGVPERAGGEGHPAARRPDEPGVERPRHVGGRQEALRIDQLGPRRDDRLGHQGPGQLRVQALRERAQGAGPRAGRQGPAADVRLPGAGHPHGERRRLRQAALTAGTPIAEPDTGPGGIYARLADLGREPVRFREEIRSRMPRPEEAKALGLGPGTPVVLLCRTAFAADGQVVEVNEMALDSAAYILEYEFDAP
ncbi:UTRA domain-containing protein [Streptomyces sp. NPDC059851]|uniref:UTRA domain-containing protein n=1 Tax=Streptomyces sp. NPDC059851 TaxID=3346971 RepID=UPI0036618453